MKGCFVLLSALFLFACNSTSKTEDAGRAVWTKEKAHEWYDRQGWLVGANFIPSTAINQLEMWQAETFDTASIDRELGWAAAIGMNTMRVYLHDLVFQEDAEGFYERINSFLAIAAKHKIRPLFVFFDSCWDPFPKTGKQREPLPFTHNSGWVQSPGYHALMDSAQYPRLEEYVKGVLKRFGTDERILGWDIWNEPDNMTGPSYEKVENPDKLKYVLPLLKQSFQWARSENPAQPITSGVWIGNWQHFDSLTPIQKVQITESDIISFHNYDSAAEFEKRIQYLQQYGKPMICTEYLARPNGSRFESFLPIAKKYHIGMYNWGLVNGKTQTIYPWDSWTKKYKAPPPVWFHDIFNADGTAYIEAEVNLIKSMTGKN